MTTTTTDPLAAAKLLFTLRDAQGAAEIAARWVLAWTAVFTEDRAEMAKAIEAATDKTVANAFRNAATATKAMAKGFGDGLPDEATRAHVEQWSPKTWQQIGAKAIRDAAVAGTLADMDPTAIRAAQVKAKAAEVDSPQGETTELEAPPMANLDQIASAIVSVLVREPQWDGMSAKNRAVITATVIDDITGRVSALTSSVIA